jgi:hypothetical protein
LVILGYLRCHERMRLDDLSSIERSKLWHDVLRGVGLSLLYAVVRAIGGVVATLALYGTPQPPRGIMGGQPVWGHCIGLSS